MERDLCCFCFSLGSLVVGWWWVTNNFLIVTGVIVATTRMASKSSAGSAFQAIASSPFELGITSSEATKQDDDASQKEPRSNNHVQEFFTNVWQTQPAVFRSCHDASVDKDCPLFKAVHMEWDDVAQMLHHCRDSPLHAPLFFQNGNPITDPTTAYANNPHAAYLDGCSIIVNHADFHHPTIANLCSIAVAASRMAGIPTIGIH